MKWKYILKRILIAIPTFFGITILAYFILNMAPGSPLDALLADPGITPAELNIINLRLDITHLYYPAKNSFQKGRLKRREIFTELLLYTLTT